VLGGADLGAGVLHLLARRGRRRRLAIAAAMGPVWEANHVWLIFFLTGLLTAFPGAFAALGARLFAPATLVVLGLAVRGAAFAFAGQLTRGDRALRPLHAVFGAASVVTPFVLGATAAGVARGTLDWIGVFPAVAGALAVALCTALAASFLAVEAGRARAPGLAGMFRRSALRATAATAALAAAGLALAGAAAPGAPAAIAGAVALLGAAVALRLRRDRLARAALAAAIAAIVWGWGLAQYPRLAGPGVTVASAAAAGPELTAVAIAFAAGAVLLVPALWLLYAVFRRRPVEVVR
jgi:cytochrome d ubiquinol oxidase subunit II